MDRLRPRKSSVKSAAGVDWPAHGLLLIGGGVWGVTFSLAKIATEAGAHPLGITLWQAIFGGLLLLALVVLRRSRLPLDRPHLVFYLICGLIGTALPSTLFFYAAPRLPAGVLSITLASVPILTFLIAVPLRLDRIAPGRVLGALLGIAAVAMIAAPETSLPDPGAAPWVLVALAASACYAGENIVIAVRRPSGSDALTVLAGMLLMAGLVLAPLVALTGTFTELAWPWTRIEYAIFSMAMINALSYAMFVALVTRAGPVFASQMAYLVTLSGVAWGIALFDEQHSLWIWGALVVMMVGLSLVRPRGA